MRAPTRRPSMIAKNSLGKAGPAFVLAAFSVVAWGGVAFAQAGTETPPPGAGAAPAAPPAEAAPPAPLPPPPPAAPPPAPVTSKFSATLYGFVEADSIFDSTESFTDLPGHGAIARPTTYAGSHGRITTAVRNTRLGFRFKGPETQDIKSSAMIEGDFIGNQPLGAPNPVGTPPVTENSFFTSPGYRIRHAMLKLETPVVDLLVGQYWELFGWQGLFHPNTVELQGMPGQLYSRTPQIRLSKTIKSDAVN